VLLLSILITLNQAIFTTYAENGQYLEAYNICMYNDSTSFLTLAIYIPQIDASTIYLSKFINANCVEQTPCGAVPGHVTGLELITYQDSIYLVTSGDSVYVNLLVFSTQNIQNGRIEQLEGPFQAIRSLKADFYQENDSAFGLLALSYQGSNGDDTVIIVKTNLTNGSSQTWYLTSFTPNYPMGIGINQLPGISLYHFYFLYVPQSNPDVYYPHIVTFTNIGPYGEYYPFSLVDVQLPSLGATSNFVLDFANRMNYPDSFLYEYSLTSGTGSWHGPVSGIGLSHFYIDEFTIGDTSYFPHIYVKDSKIFHRFFKFPSESTEPLISEEMQISDTNNFADFPLVYSHHGALRNFYRPILKYSPSKSAMCVVWHQDFWHYTSTPPYFPIRDSTILWMDLKISQKISENLAGFKIKWDIKEGMLNIISKKEEEYFLEVYDSMGKLTLKTRAKSNNPVKLNLKKKGIYFVRAVALKGVNQVVKIINL